MAVVCGDDVIVVAVGEGTMPSATGGPTPSPVRRQRVNVSWRAACDTAARLSWLGGEG